MDFFVFLIRNRDHQFVVDTGFDMEAGAQSNVAPFTSPRDLLQDLAVNADNITNVILTHMHWDHAGGIGFFPKARFLLQEADMHYCVGACMCVKANQRPYRVKHVQDVVEATYSDRVVFLKGDHEVVPGIYLHLVGGHTPGMQVVRVRTRKGWLVLASDASHLWANIRTRNPFPLLSSERDVERGYELIEQLADGPDLIIPGHDPLISKRFPAISTNPNVLRLD
nr:N-acyl homoserine lactonase family protein [Paraburkholderia sp. Cy-641]